MDLLDWMCLLFVLVEGGREVKKDTGARDYMFCAALEEHWLGTKYKRRCQMSNGLQKKTHTHDRNYVAKLYAI